MHVARKAKTKALAVRKPEPQDLVFLTRARTALAKASNLDEVKGIRDKAEAIRFYAKKAGESLEAQNAAAEIKLRAERRAGELLAAMDLSPGRPQKCTHDESNSTLEEMGLDKNESRRWQALFSLPEKDFDTNILEITTAGKELTTAFFLRLAKAAPTVEAAPLTLTAALHLLLQSVKRCLARWPAGETQAFVSGLRSLADEIETTGRLAE